MTASFSRRRRCNRSNDAAIAGVMLRPNLSGNSEGGEVSLFDSAEGPWPPGETRGGGGEVPAGVPTCRGVAASALMSFNALARAFLGMATASVATHRDGRRTLADQTPGTAA